MVNRQLAEIEHLLGKSLKHGTSITHERDGRAQFERKGCALPSDAIRWVIRQLRKGHARLCRNCRV